MVLLHFGNMHPDLVRYNTELFAEKVAPGLRTVWDELRRPVVAGRVRAVIQPCRATPEP